MPRRSTALFAAAVLFLAVLAAGYGFYLRSLPAPDGGSGLALIGGPFSMVNQDGKPVTEKDFRGRFMLIFFGYTYCPDVCPTELQVMTAAIDAMGEDGKAITPILVTVDPARDTPEVLKSYVENFGPNVVGLTGSAEQVAAMARAYRVYYAKAGSGGATDYLMDHSNIIYLMGPDGSFLRHFTFTTDAPKLASELKESVSGFTLKSQ